jgi:hypothetical protein
MGEWSTSCKRGAYTLLPANTPYIPGHVVDRGCDTPIKSFVVHSLNIGKVGPSYEGRLALFLIFLSNVPYV